MFILSSAKGRLRNWLRPSLKPEKLELISVHVPKTAGTSFRKTLQNVYGTSLQTIDDGTSLGCLWKEEYLALRPDTRAIHGHFPASQFLVKTFPKAKLIAWLRDPVERTISHYYYWLKCPSHGNPEHDAFLKNPCTVEEFANFGSMREQIQLYLGRVQREQFHFIGLTEHYSESINRLAELMHWQHLPVYEENRTERKSDIDPDKRELMRKALAEEIAFYERYAKKW